MSGLDEEQLSELEYRVGELLEEQWDKGTGRPRELTLREALGVSVLNRGAAAGCVVPGLA